MTHFLIHNTPFPYSPSCSPLPNPPFPQLCPPCASVFGWWNHSKFNSWNWVGSWASSPLSSDCNKNASQEVESQPSSYILHHMRILFLSFQSNQLCDSFVMLIGFWASPSSSGKDNGCQGSMLYVQHTFSVISFLDVFMVYVSILKAHVDVRSTVWVENFNI